MRKIFKIALKIFRKILLTISIILILLSIIAVVFTILDSINLDLALNKQGFIYYLNLFDSFKTLLAATFIIIPVYIALETLISNINNQESKALLDLRGLLNEPENLEIHKKLRGESGDWAMEIPKREKDNKDTWRKIDNYLGILELINILIEKDVISKENFDNQFGYRVDNVFINHDINEYLDSYENKEIVWKELYSLFGKRGLKK
jgi:hypothetical protein